MDRTFFVHTFAGAAALIALTVTAQAQVTKAQQDAIRANCRSDFMANCSSVTPGGKEAFMCLEQNKAKLSAGCRGAVDAVAAAAAPKPATPPPAATRTEPAATPAAAPPAEKPAASAPPPATRPAKQPPAPKAAAAPARTAPPPPPATAAAPAAVPPAPPPVQTHQPTLGEAALIRRFCFTDFRVLCKGVPLGQGRAVKCLASNGPSLSPGCRQAMVKTGELVPQ